MGIFDKTGLRYIGHRGFTPLAPQNSLPGFEYAGILKYWAIETDVHMSADSVLVCNHNKSVDATYNGNGLIAEKTWSELSKLRLNCGNRLDCFRDEQLRMPLFAEYLSICKKYDCVPFIEMKTDHAQALLQATRDAGFDDSQIVISSSKLHRLIAARQHSNDVFLHWIFASEEDLDQLCALGNAGISWNYPNCRECPMEKIELARKKGLKLCLRAGDNVEDVKYMQELGLDYIPTNCMHE